MQFLDLHWIPATMKIRVCKCTPLFECDWQQNAPNSNICDKEPGEMDGTLDKIYQKASVFENQILFD